MFLDGRCFFFFDSNVGWLHNAGAKSLFITWNKCVFSYDSHVEGMGFIVEYGQYLRSNLKCTIVNVYVI